ncbi:hypothetical protein SLE2022_376620 [Rubroshorea leprosula]
MEELGQTAYYGRDHVQLGLAAASIARTHPIQIGQNQTGKELGESCHLSRVHSQKWRMGMMIGVEKGFGSAIHCSDGWKFS